MSRTKGALVNTCAARKNDSKPLKHEARLDARVKGWSADQPKFGNEHRKPGSQNPKK